VILLDWYNSSGSDYDFEFRLCNEYTISHFELDGGADNLNSYAKKLNKNNTGLYLLPWGNYNEVYNSYQPLGNYELNNLYFHWNIIKFDNYICEIENVMMNSELHYVKMKEYGLHYIKLFRLNDGIQHCKIWFTNDGINIIPIWFKRLLVEYAMFY
jgi:hypothetical protein